MCGIFHATLLVLCTCAFHPIADDDGEPESVHAHLHRGADARASRHAHSLLLQHVLLTADSQSAPRLAADLLRGRSLPVKVVKRALTRPLALPEPTTAAVASGHAEAQRHMVAGAALPRLPVDSSVAAAAAASGGFAGFGAQSTYKQPPQQQSQSQSNLSGGSDSGSATATTSERIVIEREPREIRPHVMRALSFVQPPPPFQPLTRFAPAAAAVPFHSQLQQQHQQFQQQHHHHHNPSAHASAQPPPPPPNAFIASLCDAPIAQQQTLVVALLHMGRTAAALAPPPPPPPPIVFRRIVGGGASASASSGTGSGDSEASSSTALKSPRFVSSPPPSAIIAAAAAPLTAEDAVSDSMALAVASALRYSAPDAGQSLCTRLKCERSSTLFVFIIQTPAQ
jgi:hypothetical protein